MNVSARLQEASQRVQIVPAAPCSHCQREATPHMLPGESCTAGHTRRNASNSVPEPRPCSKCLPDSAAPFVEPGNECEECGKKSKRPRYRCSATNDPVPGVTSILSAMVAKPQLVPWAARVTVEYIEDALTHGRPLDVSLLAEARRAHARKRDEGAHIGTLAHDCLQAWITGDPWESYLPDDPEARAAVLAGLAWLESKRPAVVATEAVCVAPSMPGETPAWCGRADLVYAEGDGLVVADWKSTRSGLYPEGLLQGAAYSHAVQVASRMPVLRFELIHVDRESGGFRVATIAGDDLQRAMETFDALASARLHLRDLDRITRLVMQSSPVTRELAS